MVDLVLITPNRSDIRAVEFFINLRIREMVGRVNKMICLSDPNYYFWKCKMSDLLFVKSLHLPVFATQKPDFKSDEDWEFEHEQVCEYIRQFVDENVYKRISSEKNAKALWKKLELLYASMEVISYF